MSGMRRRQSLLSGVCPGRLAASLNRRDMLKRTANGFGLLALSALMARKSYAGLTPKVAPAPQFPVKAKSVIFCFMDGGVSHIESFDPKPKLDALDGKDVRISKKQNPLRAGLRQWLGSRWKFRQHGESGISVSELFPHMAECVDDLAVIRSMQGDFPLHSRGNLLLHTGRSLAGHPSLGSWVNYGLGSENHNLPGFVVLHNGMNIPSGLDNFTSGYLPASYQATLVRTEGTPIDNLAAADTRLQRAKLDFLQEQDREFSSTQGSVDAIDSAIENYELAYRMQSLVPDVLDLSRESETTKKLYGVDSSDVSKSRYGIQCLRARRLVEVGVRFVEVTCPMLFGNTGTWDQHGNLKKGHERNAFVVDQGIAALLKDLKARGLLEETLVVWSGEFGRTPHSVGKDGRDHHPYGFSLWMAGAGIRGGMVYGETDELGMQAVDKVTTFHDLHATILHLLGLDHEKLTYRHAGRDFSLTDVHGDLIRDILT
jgi:hypothetical protein